ncbi:hypothetical protein DSP71_04810 [Microbacterium sp. H6]|nr:hypothetical protein DSP71_04810 [Microbacterium sp. H6]
MTPRTPNPTIHDYCRACFGWGAHTVRKGTDYEDEIDCLDCGGSGIRRGRNEPMNTNALAHTGDPEVSHIAAISLTGTNTEKVMHVVVDLLHELGPQTPAELEHVYRSRRAVNDWPQVAFYSIHKRVSQMKKHIRVLRGTGIRAGGAERVELAMEPLRAHTHVTTHMQGDA